MKLFKNKKVMIAAVAVLALLLVVFVGMQLRDNLFVTKKTVKILDYGTSLCTMDIPSSICSGYDVTTQTLDGKSGSYSVEGYEDEKESDRYYEISSLIAEAESKNSIVTIKLNKEGYIVGVE